MPYIFVALVIANAALFGYFRLNPSDNAVDVSVEQARTELKQPIKFVNSTHEIPPLIGEK